MALCSAVLGTRVFTSQGLCSKIVLRKFNSSSGDKHLRALVVGAGLSGSIFALSLVKRGIKPRVIDHARDATTYESLPTGVFLSTNAMQGLQTLGIAEEVAHQGKIINTHALTHHDGKLSFGRVSYARLNSRVLPVGIEYSKLLKVVRTALANHGVPVWYQASISSIKEQPGAKSFQVHYSGNAGRAFASNVFDLVVGADGENSKMRETMFPENLFRTSLRPGQYELYECVVRQPPGQDLDSYTEMWGEGGRLTILPIGSDHISISASQNALYGTQYVRQGMRDYREFRNRFMTRFGGVLAPKIIQGIEQREQEVYMRSPQMIRMKSWVNGRVVLIGNAAHAMLSPHTQEAAMCVEDALVLSHLVSEHENLESALDQYVTQRFQRVYNIQKDAQEDAVAARTATPFKKFLRLLRMRFTHLSPVLSHHEKKMITSTPPQMLVKVDKQ